MSRCVHIAVITQRPILTVLAIPVIAILIGSAALREHIAEVIVVVGVGVVVFKFVEAKFVVAVAVAVAACVVSRLHLVR